MSDKFPGNLIGGPDAPHTFEDETAMGKRLSDPGDAMWIAGTENWTQEARDALALSNPGLFEIRRMEHLMSKAPCLARLDELAAYAAKDDDDIQPQT